MHPTYGFLLTSLCSLVESTKVDETDEVYFTKLALSLGRSGSSVTGVVVKLLIFSLAILRPKLESEISIQDRHPTCKFYSFINYMKLGLILSFQLCSLTFSNIMMFYYHQP